MSSEENKTKTEEETGSMSTESLSEELKEESSPASPAATERKMERWMIAVDESQSSMWAFNSTLNHMDKENDDLLIVAVTSKNVRDETETHETLPKYAARAVASGVKNLKLVVAVKSEAPRTLVKLAEKYKIDTFTIGSRKKRGYFERMKEPSVAKYCMHNCDCNVNIAHSPVKLAEVPKEDRMPDISQVNVRHIKALQVGDHNFEVDISY